MVSSAGLASFPLALAILALHSKGITFADSEAVKAMEKDRERYYHAYMT
jgi:hypothetical protein